MALTMMLIKLDARLVDEASKILGVMSWKEAVHLVLGEIVAIHRFKKLMKNMLESSSSPGVIGNAVSMILSTLPHVTVSGLNAEG
jgi:hypothetical protein